MQAIPNTIPMSAFSKTPRIVSETIRDAPAMVMNRSDAVGMLVNTQQWNRMVAELDRLRLFADARRIAESNDANNSWTPGTEMRKIMEDRHGVVAD